MPSSEEAAEVKKIIESFYDFAAVSLPTDLVINEAVAEVFGRMLEETKKCSHAFGWVPTPPTGRATIGWLASQLGRGVFNSYRSRLSFACARRVIYAWSNKLREASFGLAKLSAPKLA